MVPVTSPDSSVTVHSIYSSRNGLKKQYVYILPLARNDEVWRIVQ
jgi:hypothetical protein